jgi:CHAD domain-containing protein
MAYRFKLDETVDKGVRRVAKDQIARAEVDIGRTGAEAAAGVHECRKSIKRLRALLRLVRPQIGEKAFKSHNGRLRNINQALAGSRDHSILEETVAKLEARFGSEGVTAMAPVRQRLAEVKNVLPEPLQGTTVQSARTMLAKESRRLDTLKFKGSGFEILAAGLEESYEAGRRALAKAYKNPTSEAFHDLRKGVQWHWRQMTLLSRTWPEYFDVRVAAARELSQILGDDHDLAVLMVFAKSVGATADSAEYVRIEKLAHARQTELRAKVRPRAIRLFAEPPEDFVRRIAKYWETGRHLKSQTKGSDDAPDEAATPAPAWPTGAPRLTVKVVNDAPSQPVKRSDKVRAP